MEARIIQWKLSVLPRGWGPIYTPAREATPLAGPDVQRGGERTAATADSAGRTDKEVVESSKTLQLSALSFKNYAQKSRKNEY